MRMRATDVLRRPVAMNSCVWAIIESGLAELYRFRLLSRMRMRITPVHFQFSVNRPPETIMRNHSSNCTLHQQLWVPGAPRAGVFRFMAPDESGKAHKSLQLFF